MRRWMLGMAAWLGVVCGLRAQTLKTLEYRVSGSALDVMPAVLSVPKGIAGSVTTRYSGDASLVKGAYVVATLRGGGAPSRELLGAPGQPLMLPALNVAGDYQLDGIQLVRDEGTRRVVVMDASPRSVPVRVFEEVLVTRVTSRPLTTDEIREKGIFLDDSSFRVTEFEVGLVLDGKTIPIKAPVVSPRAAQSTELVPRAEVEQRLAQAEALNQQIAEQIPLPREAQVAGIQVKGIAFQFTEDTDGKVGLSIPPIPALMVIPGNIGFLNQFFSVQVFTENAAPAGSGLSVFNVQARLVLPPGTDRMAGTGDDPLRFARVGASAEVLSQLPVRGVGPDGKAGTDDDVSRLQPGEGGTCEFLVEGLREGLHVLDLALTAELEGLAAGVVKVTGTAAGSVLVRNPRFSLAFSSPRTVRAQEPYWASVTLLNTSETPANEVSVTLPTAAVSGAELLGEPTVRLGTILPGQSATARYRLKALRTGRVRFSNLSFGDEVTSGQFRLSMGVDERGVELSPDSFGMPDDALRLPEGILAAADRVLGQALSAVTAPLVPRGVVRPQRPILRTRILELTEAGQRLRLGDDPGRVYADLLLDWQGGREFDAGLDQILRETEAGRQWRDAVALELGRAMEGGPGEASGAPALLGRLAADLAGRGESWGVVADDAMAAGVEVDATLPEGVVGMGTSAVPRAMSYTGPQGRWWVFPGGSDPRIRWRLGAGLASMRVARLELGTNGVGRLDAMALGAQPVGGCVSLTGTTVSADADCDGMADAEVAGAGMEVRELPPRVIRVVQDPLVLAGRPEKLCLPPMDVLNYGTVVAVLFSKPMSPGLGGQASLFGLDDGNGAQSVQIQPGGRMALVNLRRGVSAIRPRRMTVGEVSDVRGNRMTPSTAGIVHRLGDGEWKAGVAVNGRVLRADGSPAVGVPVTLTMEDEAVSFEDCAPYVFRVSQVTTDARGEFTFDFVLAGPRYAVSATDTTGLSGEAMAALVGTDESAEARRVLTELAERNPGTLLAAFAVGSLPEAVALVEGLDRAVVRDQVTSETRHGTTNVVGLQFRGRGTVLGTVYQPGTTIPAPNVAVNLFPDPGSRERGRGVTTDGSGRFAFFGVPLGVFTVEVDDGLGHATTVDGLLAKPGEAVGLDIPLLDVPVRFGGVTGRVTEPDGTTPAAGATVYVGEVNNRRVGRIVASTTSGADGSFAVSRVPEGTWAVVAFASDGSRVGLREGIRISDGVATTVSVDLEGFGRLTGRVLTAGGEPVAGALVSGGLRLATTDEGGRFEIADIPVGRRTVSAAVTPELNPAVRVGRRGSRTVEVLPGTLNVSDIILDPAGVVKGTVRDQDGKPMPGVRVAKPVEGGFLHVQADERGFYRFEGLALGEHVFSAPAPPVAETDVGGILDVLSGSPSEEALQAAIMDAFAIFTGMRDPLLNGEGAAFSPSSWGYNTGRIDADDQEVTVDITYMRRGSVGGVVRNGQGVLIGARVQVASIAPANNGLPTLRVSGEMDSDAAAGTWAFENAVRLGGGAIRPSSVLPIPGTFRLFCASPFFPVVLEQGGQLNEVRPAIRDVEFRFPPPRETQGRMAGRVFNPDGTDASDGVRVLVPYEGVIGVTEAMQSRGFREDDVRNAVTQQVGADLGPAGKATAPEFPPTALLPAPARYEVYAVDPVTGWVGRSTVTVEPGVTNRVDVRLLGPGALTVRVADAAGLALPGAEVRVQAMGFPHGRFTGGTDAIGQLSFEGVIEGRYEVFAAAVVGASRAEGRAVVDVPRGSTALLEVRLAASGTVAGTYLRRDGTPVIGAQVRVNGFLASTDAAGSYRVPGVPLGAYVVRSEDPVTGLGVEATGVLAAHGSTVRIDLREPFLGEVTGTVLDGFRTGVVPGGPVTLVHASGLHPVRRGATDATGRYRFAGVPAGVFRVEATDPRTGLRGEASGTVSDIAPAATVNVLMEPRVNVRVTVLDGAGLPASASVRVAVGDRLFEGDTAADGVAVFGNLPTGVHRVTARSMARAGSRDVGSEMLPAMQPGEASVLVRLRGVGETTGRVLMGDGVTPVPAGTEVQLTGLARELADLNDTVPSVFTDALGMFRFGNVAAGDNRLLVRMGGLSATATYLQPAGAVTSQDLVLTAAGTVAGRVLRETGAPAALVQATLLFGSRGGFADRVSAATGVDGRFELADVPLGQDMALRLSAEGFDGIRDVRVTVASNGQRVELGDLVLDESAPRLVATDPPDHASGVSTRASLVLDFSEALDVASLGDGGLRLVESVSGAPVPFVATLEKASDGVMRRVRLTPLSPLRSETRHGLLVVPAMPRAGGGLDTSPRDLAGRLVDRTSSITFLTADNDPPRLVSIFPADGEVNVNIGTLTNALTPRVTFNEPVRDGVAMVLTGPDGVITGRAEVSAGGLVARFLTDRLLRSNTRYTLVVSNVLDLAGNEALAQPFLTTFDSVDDIGPELSVLRLRDGVAPVAGRRVEIEALLAQPEDGARVRFLSGLTNLLGFATSAPHRLAVTLPADGSVVFTAIAQDRFGNDGAVRRLVVETVPDQPPSVALALEEPATVPVTRGQPFRIRATATDDVGVTTLRLVGQPPLALDETVSGSTHAWSFKVPNAAPATGTADVVVVATDTSGQRATNVLAIAWKKVNQQPVARHEVALVEPGRLRVTLGGTDADDDAVTAEVMAWGEGIRVFQTVDGTTPTGEITAPGTRVTDAQGRVLLEVPPRFAGTARVQFQVSDGEATSVAAWVDTTLRGAAWAEVAGLFDTGVDDAGAALADGVTDPHYRLVVNADGPGTEARVHASAIFPIVSGPWLANGTRSKWIAPRVDTAGAAAGRYQYEQTWVIDDVIGETAVLEGGWAMDDAGEGLRVNGVLLAVASSGYGALAPFQVTNALASGTNRIVFGLVNAGGQTGLRVEGLRAFGLRRDFFAGKDADADGIDDAVELAHGLEPEDATDAAMDPDGDGLSNRDELVRGTRMDRADTDGDGLSDGVEVARGCLDPLRADTDGDGSPDGVDQEPCRAGLPPVALVPDAIEVVAGTAAELRVRGADVDGNLARLEVIEEAVATRRLDFSGPVEGALSGTASIRDGVLELTPAAGGQLGGFVLPTDGTVATTSYRVAFDLFIGSGSGADGFSFCHGPGLVVPFGEQGSGSGLRVQFDTFPNGSAEGFDDEANTIEVWHANTRLSKARGIPLRNHRFVPVEIVVVGGRVTVRHDGVVVADDVELPGWSPQPGWGMAMGARTGGAADRHLVDNLEYTSVLGLALDWVGPGGRRLDLQPPVGEQGASVRVLGEREGTTRLTVTATDADGLRGTAVTSVTVLPDLDRDGIADRDDADVDGDGLANVDEALRGTDPRVRDTDGDGLGDGVEVAGGCSDPLKPDTDGDGLVDGADPDPCKAAARPVLGAAGVLEAVEGVGTNFTFSASDADANLARWRRRLAGHDGALRMEFHGLDGVVSSVGGVAFEDRTLVSVTRGGNLDFRAGSGVFAPGVPGDLFAVRATGWIDVPAAGAWTFHLTSDDGSTLSLDGGAFLVNDGVHPDVTVSGTRQLGAGPVPFEVRMFENFGGATLVLEWEGPGVSRQVIPASAFIDPVEARWAGVSDELILPPGTASSVVTLSFRSSQAGQVQLTIEVVDTDGFAALQTIPVTVLPDLDRDGIADRDDADVDGDGLANVDEALRGTDPRVRDTDGDTLLDGAEVLAGTDPLKADTDGDTVPDATDPFPTVVNRAPVAGDDVLGTIPGEPVSVTMASLLANDVDPDGDRIEFVGFVQPVTGGVVRAGAAGELVFEPAAGVAGVEVTFGYTVADVWGQRATGVVRVAVRENTRPLAGEVLPYASGGLTFDGIDDGVNGPVMAGIADDFTVEFWAWPARTRGVAVEQATGAAGQFVGEFAVFPAHGDTLGGGLHAGMGVSVGKNGVVVVEHAANYFPTPLVHDVSLSEWTHVAVVYEGRRPTLYLNGDLVRVGLRSDRVVHPSAFLSIALGRFAGQMDEFRVWDHARTAAQVREAHRRRLAGGERGLALLWRMDEPGGTTLVDHSPHRRDGTLTGGTGRVMAAATLTARGVRETAFTGAARVVRLPGIDAEGQPLMVRIDALPRSGRLFQFTAGAAGAEIALPGARVEDAASRVVYVPDDGFAGDDALGFTVSDGLLDSFMAEASMTVRAAIVGTTDDVWDVSRGVTVLGTSGVHPQSAAANLFGGMEGSVEPGNTLFRDGAPAGTVHSIEWRTPGPVAVRGLEVFLADDQPASMNRGVSMLRVYGRTEEDGTYQRLATYPVASNPYFGGQRFQARVEFPEFVGTFFRAEFDQVASGPAAGPRVEELDAIGERVAWVPSPEAVVLRNATSDGAQGGFPPWEMIDGIIEGGGTQNGWAGDVGGTPSLTAVFETSTDLPSTASSEFVFRIVQPYGSGHALGCFRLSATTDSRDAFADGLASGGDVSATWTVLRVTEVTSAGGETFEVRPDQSVLVTGAQPGATTYVVRARGVAGRVTGFRLEALEDPALSNNGPGRTGHGNWVVNEFTVSWPGGPLQIHRAPRGIADAAQAFQGEPVVLRLLANDTDADGDPLSVDAITGLDPAQGSVQVRDDGAVVFEPAASFLGVATFRYRPADPYQQGDETEVRIDVQARPPLITSAGSATGRVGAPFVYQTVAARFPTGFGATGLPPGVMLDGATGSLSGVPSQAGLFNVVLVATNAAGSARLDLAVSIGLPAIELLDTLGPVGAFDPQPFGAGSVGAAFSGLSESDPTATGERAAVAFTVPSGTDVSLDGVSMALSQAFGPVNARVLILENEPSFGSDGVARDVPGAVVAVLAVNPPLGLAPSVRSFVPSGPVVLRSGNRYWMMVEPSVAAGLGSTRWHGAVGSRAIPGMVATGSWNTAGRSWNMEVNANAPRPAVRLDASAVASVPNGDFELPVLSSGGSATLASLGGSFGGWSAVGAEAERVSIVAAGGGSDAAAPDLRTPRRGRQALVSQDGADFTLVMGNLVPGDTYRLVYASKQVRVGGRFTSIPGGSVLADGVPIVTLFETGPSASNYATLESKQGGLRVTSAYFTATSTSARIDFRPEDIPSVVDHYCIDDVRLERVEALGTTRWKRMEQWVEGTSPFTSFGNPAPDGRGHPTWAYEWTDNVRDGATPFHAARRIRMVWDPSWGGAWPSWASGNDTVPMVLQAGAIAFNWRQAPVVGWIKPASAASAVEVRGHVGVSWFALDGAPFPHSVLLAVVKVATDGTTTELLARTVAPDDGTFPGEVLVPVHFPSVPMQAGDRIHVTCLIDIPASGPTFSAVVMSDDLVFSEVGGALGGSGLPSVSMGEALAAGAETGRVAAMASEDASRVTPVLAVDRPVPGLLTVRYRVVRGNDAGVDGERAVPAGASGAPLPALTPARTGGLAPAEVVRVRLMEGAGYALGVESERAYVLAGSAFAQWQAARFTAAELLAGRGEAGADADADGESNLLEFAMGGDGRLRLGREAGDRVFEYVRRAGGRTLADGSVEVDGLRYVLEGSDDLRGWSPAAGRVEMLGMRPAGVPGYERVILRPGGAGGFLRLRIEPSP